MALIERSLVLLSVKTVAIKAHVLFFLCRFSFVFFFVVI